MKSRSLILLTAAAALGTGWLGADAHADSGFGCGREPVKSVPFVESVDAGGAAKLCVLPERLEGRIKLTNLVPDNAYTVWWVYFDTPTQCTGEPVFPGAPPLGAGDSACDFSDFLGMRPQAVFGRMASGVAPRRGVLNLSGTLGGMEPSSGAEVWYLVFGHGPAKYGDGAALARQLLTPEDPGAGTPHLGIEGDMFGYPVSVAVFELD